MGGPGIDLRMPLLLRAADQHILKPLKTHGWNAEITLQDRDGEYIIVSASKAGVNHKVALLYTSATDNRHYKALSAQAEHIFINGGLYKLESFAYGISTPVTPIEEFFPALLSWNKELAPANPAPPRKPPARTVRRITSENPREQIWSRLDQFASPHLAKKLVIRRAKEDSKDLSEDIVRSKAEGVAFSIRNASDYFRAVPFESLNKRVLSLYYGTLSLAFAEMLASPSGPADLDEVEGMTQQGHGLNTVPSGPGDFEGLAVVVRNVGFFPQWVSFLGQDASGFPSSKPKSRGDLDKTEKFPPGTYATLAQLFSALPELGDLFLEVFDIPPSWVFANFDTGANLKLGAPDSQNNSSYITLFDPSGRLEQPLLEKAPWPIAEITILEAAGTGRTYRARVDHPGQQFWQQALPLHRSPFQESTALILPVLDGVTDYRTAALVVLYALSILVRYKPSTWRRIEGGDQDQYLTLVKTALAVFERILPEVFLETIIGERVQVRQPGSFF
ncbi:MAG: YaaC family protein [Rhodomicrobium sp.]